MEDQHEDKDRLAEGVIIGGIVDVHHGWVVKCELSGAEISKEQEMHTITFLFAIHLNHKEAIVEWA